MRLTVGMTGDKITEKLGPPASIGIGRGGMHKEFSGIRPGMLTTEWIFRRGDDTIVVWLENNAAIAFGLQVHHTQP